MRRVVKAPDNLKVLYIYQGIASIEEDECGVLWYIVTGPLGDYGFQLPRKELADHIAVPGWVGPVVAA